MTVVIPTRNRWETLARFGLRAALSQGDVVKEIVVVDDGSEERPSGSGLIQDDRVIVERLPGHMGVAAARNAGVMRATTDWVALLDDDDIWAPERLERLVRSTAAAGRDFGYSSVLVVDAALRPVASIEAPVPKDLSGLVRRSGGVYASASNIVVRRALFEDLGGFDPTFSTAADWEFVFRLVAAGSGHAVREPLLAYRASGWMVENEPEHRADLERLERKHPGIGVDWPAFERAIALGLHRAGRRREAAGRYLSVAARNADFRSLLLAASCLVNRETVDRWRRLRPIPQPSWLQAYDSQDS